VAHEAPENFDTVVPLKGYPQFLLLENTFYYIDASRSRDHLLDFVPSLRIVLGYVLVEQFIFVSEAIMGICWQRHSLFTSQ